MARISRLVVPDYPHHLTQRGVRSMAVFDSDDDRRAYLAFISEESQRHGVTILAWCLMTNHVHFVAIPTSDNSLARCFGEAHRRYPEVTLTVEEKGDFFWAELRLAAEQVTPQVGKIPEEFW